MHEDPLDLLLSYEQIAVQIRNIQFLHSINNMRVHFVKTKIKFTMSFSLTSNATSASASYHLGKKSGRVEEKPLRGLPAANES